VPDKYLQLYGVVIPADAVYFRLQLPGERRHHPDGPVGERDKDLPSVHGVHLDVKLRQVGRTRRVKAGAERQRITLPGPQRHLPLKQVGVQADAIGVRVVDERNCHGVRTITRSVNDKPEWDKLPGRDSIPELWHFDEDGTIGSHGVLQRGRFRIPSPILRAPPAEYR
jgi:hypothetical protein